MNIQYRKLLPEESKMYRTVRLESLQQFPESFGVTYEEALKYEKLKMELDIENQTRERFVIGAFKGHQLIGICTFVKDENDIGHIYQMYVKRKFQGNNIGNGLIHKTIEEAYHQFKDLDIYLEVKKINLSAYSLYKKIGFAEINKPLSYSDDSVIILKLEKKDH
ncbi:ribosomal protein S18 acetylase RimI-like enzyme [Chryseobacterium sp. SORGH_AS 447]|uniref:GNAT family N-acetyltransferase n=1 Tax=Chryseobacterium sp. SORGH_AS_0447 TaxID=3041769 RepID=UPI00278B53D9|nr:GNAT family N-acetyltransferase [Chryseobacterium sp. SORGH_AS_0447]MDQ1163118.1 ribosomal protein S18 acetylase RimI-like enzyme [Chryseobacterium sp. SORGH_AS_0447]